VPDDESGGFAVLLWMRERDELRVGFSENRDGFSASYLDFCFYREDSQYFVVEQDLTG
jgi:hypothetical protein